MPSGPVDPPLTSTQRAYLAAFDRYLRAETPYDQIRARDEMSDKLALVLDDAKILPVAHRPLHFKVVP